MQTQEMKTRSLTGWSRRGKVLLTLMVSALCVEGAMAVQNYVFDANPCVINDGNFTSAEGGCQDLRTGRVWSRNGYGRTNSVWTYLGATNYCSTLTEGGYSDWRLPTRVELQTVVADGAATYLNVFYRQKPDGTVSYTDPPRWSSTTFKKGKLTLAYAIYLRTGEEITTNTAPGTSAIDMVCTR